MQGDSQVEAQIMENYMTWNSSSTQISDWYEILNELRDNSSLRYQAP